MREIRMGASSGVGKCLAICMSGWNTPSHKNRQTVVPGTPISILLVDEAVGIIGGMKITDDYSGKLEIWAREGKAVRMPRIANLPAFGHRRFSSYAELQAWKTSLLDELIKQGGARWTK